MRGTSLFLGAVIAAVPSVASAALFTDDFEVDNTANWSFNSFSAGDTRNDNANNEADFFFDYSTAGIPMAPGSTTTRGLKLEANVPDGAGLFQGLSVSPIGQSFTGDYVLRFHSWHNFPTTGVGSTQMAGGGIGGNTTTAQFPGGTIDGVYFVSSSDGGNALDYRAYINSGAPLAETSGAYAAGNTAGSTNNTNSYYASFGENSVPAAQVTAYPQQSATYVSPAGTQGLEWHAVEIRKLGDTVTYSIDGTLIATANAAGELTGSNIFLGLFDINTTTTDASGRPVNFALFDNVSVELVPEPGSFALLGLGGLALAARRRR